MLTIEDVEQFHRAFGHPIGDPKRYKSLLDSEQTTYKEEQLLMLRMDLIREELSEAQEAYETNDATLFADALFDLLYVTLGAIVALGVPREIGDIVHKSNMSKGVTCVDCNGRGSHEGKPWGPYTYACSRCGGTGTMALLREDGKVLKGPDWVDDKPLIAECIERNS